MRELMGRLRLNRPFYLSMAVALISLMIAAIGIANGFHRIVSAGAQVELGYRRIAATNAVMAIARDEETGQRGFILTGQERFLKPYLAARAQAPKAWSHLVQLASDAELQVPLHRLRQAFDQKSALNDRALQVARTDGIVAGQRFVEKGAGHAKMEELRQQSDALIAHDQRLLLKAKEDSETAYRSAIIQAVIASFAFLGVGALLSFTARQSRIMAGQSEAHAKAAEERFQAVFEQAGVGMMHMAADGRPLLVNTALCTMTGYSKSDFLGAAPSSPTHPSQLFGDQVLQQQLKTGKLNGFKGERWTSAKDGRAICLQIIMTRVLSAKNETAFLSALVLDATDRRRAEDNYLESQKRLRDAQSELAHIGRVNAMGEMAAAIAHEVNQPLTAIVNYLAAGKHMLAKLPVDKGEIPGLMQRASDLAMRASQIIQRLRSFVERGSHTHIVQELDPLIEDAIDLARLGYAPDQFDVAYTSGAGNPALNIDTIQVQQILIILIRNAAEAFRPTKNAAQKLQIELKCSFDEASAMVSICVSDNGPGIPADAAEHIFQPFFSSKSGNLGMGLPIAKRLAESQGGNLSLIARDQGATFCLQLPAIRGPRRTKPSMQT